ncbi:4-(cytidine 5'-diphospho)-2-C-methyl-D-erythritol kinase [Sediminitomix flava]|uniref:4-diphosphocytidyl-2-C-methyl-D-erythritol kinase n=1 Tax=Sediminitomix flava TaxID=379075 RepID=A0A315Z7B2_SEDFL|nr:4-(cytidine 5'-diphospho)-2-C-methyl-D-erythritol kinase [Sediminitomix flava]PWJ40122.1 4-diphosphocytidyl-2-C-methyl-D-erythritol kinase [Sediminitomix flava]
MIVFPNAKINIGLNIVSKREDGFHNIESCFYPVEWEENLEIIKSNEFQFTSSGIHIPTDGGKNLCEKAYDLIAADYDISPVKIHLDKRIPIGAGLGGGSADASFCLKLINQIFELGISDQQLETYAAELGSDCPFFIKNKPKWVLGRGEIFEDIKLNLSGKFIVLVYPNIHISTKEAYSGVIPKVSLHQTKEILENSPIEEWQGKIKNDFEDGLVKKYPVFETISNQLRQAGAEYVSMTGSGSTYYGIFKEETEVDFPKDYITWKGKLQ